MVVGSRSNMGLLLALPPFAELTERLECNCPPKHLCDWPDELQRIPAPAPRSQGLVQQAVIALQNPPAVRTVKGGEKPYQRGGAKLDHFWRGEGFDLLDLQGWLERRPAPHFAGARLGRSGSHPCRSPRQAGLE